MWKAMTSRDRNLYVWGMLNAIRFLAPKETSWPEGLTWTEGEAMMNDLYSRPENVSIPIVFAMQAITMKVGGATPLAYEDFLAASRRLGKRASIGRSGQPSKSARELEVSDDR
jgi:hypothetical protein